MDSAGALVWESYRYLGQKTNNEAEYQALIDLLDEVNSRGIQELEVRGDSQLVLSQVQKKWKINKDHLRLLAEQVWEKTPSLKIKWIWVPREQNKLADELSNRAIDTKNVQPNPAGTTSQEELSGQKKWRVEEKLSAVLCVLGGKSVAEVATQEELDLLVLEQWVTKAKDALIQSLQE